VREKHLQACLGLEVARSMCGQQVPHKILVLVGVGALVLSLRLVSLAAVFREESAADDLGGR
jgi:hypothetical protein